MHGEFTFISRALIDIDTGVRIRAGVIRGKGP